MALDTSNAWYTERDKLAIVSTSSANSQTYSDPEAGKNVKVHGTKYDSPFDSRHGCSGTVYNIIQMVSPLYPKVTSGTSGDLTTPHGLIDGDLVKITGTNSHDGIFTVQVYSGTEFLLLEGVNETDTMTDYAGSWVKVSPIGMDEEPNLPTQFHRALAYKVIAHGYEIQGSQEEDANVLQLANYWNTKFEQEVMEAKKYANRKRNSGGYSIIPQDY